MIAKTIVVASTGGIVTLLKLAQARERPRPDVPLLARSRLQGRGQIEASARQIELVARLRQPRLTHLRLAPVPVVRAESGESGEPPRPQDWLCLDSRCA